MKRRLIATLAVLLGALAAMRWFVVDPYIQNRLLRIAAEARPTASTHTLRELAERLDPDLMDPDLGGHIMLEEARIARRLGRDSEAVLMYEKALTMKVYPPALVEFAIYNFELGQDDRAWRLLVEAYRLSPSLTGQSLGSLALRRELARRIQENETSSSSIDSN